MSTTDDQTINLPQLFLVIFLGCIALRYFFFSSDSPPLPGRASSSSSSSARRAREADVERIQQMFPQVERRSIMWDLQRNGGNVVATTERILSGRGLEVVSLFVYLLYTRINTIPQFPLPIPIHPSTYLPFKETQS